MRFINKVTMEAEFRLRHGLVVEASLTAADGTLRQRFYNALGELMRADVTDAYIGDISRMSHCAALDITPDPIEVTHRPDGTVESIVTAGFTTIRFSDGWLIDDQYNGLGPMRDAWMSYINRKKAPRKGRK